MWHGNSKRDETEEPGKLRLWLMEEEEETLLRDLSFLVLWCHLSVWSPSQWPLAFLASATIPSGHPFWRCARTMNTSYSG